MEAHKDSLLQELQTWHSVIVYFFAAWQLNILTHALHLFLYSGNRILTLGEVPKDQVYGVKLKGVSVCFAMLKAVLSGNYVNFGVFRLYGDDALDNALQTFIKLLLSIPHSDLLVCSLIILFRTTSHTYNLTDVAKSIGILVLYWNIFSSLNAHWTHWIVNGEKL